MDTEKPPSSPEADIGVQQIPAAESVPAHQPPGEESKDAAKRAASPTAEHNKTADQQPVFEATTTKSEEQGPQLPAAIASVRPRIYERYEQDAEVRFSVPPFLYISPIHLPLPLSPTHPKPSHLIKQNPLTPAPPPEILHRPLGHPPRPLPRPRPTPQARSHARHNRHPPHASPPSRARLATPPPPPLPGKTDPLAASEEELEGAEMLHYFCDIDVFGGDGVCVFDCGDAVA